MTGNTKEERNPEPRAIFSQPTGLKAMNCASQSRGPPMLLDASKAQSSECTYKGTMDLSGYLV